MNWLDKQPSNDIQTAIQSQSLQTALEANTSKISDAGFQSFLTNAPIPRFYAPTLIGTYNAVANTIATFSQAGYVDPYKMLAPTTGIVTFPIDGFYSLFATLNATGSAASFVQIYFLSTASAILSIQGTAAIATNVYQLAVPLVAAFKAGDTVRMNVANNGAAALSGVTGAMGGVWCGPYYNYTTGAGGN